MKLLKIAATFALFGAFVGFCIGVMGYAMASMAADSAAAATGYAVTSRANASWLYNPALALGGFGAIVGLIAHKLAPTR